jgi:hypothetical protein
MAVSSYASLASAIASLRDINYSDISAIADIIVDQAEKRIFREVRSLQMETALSATIAAGVLAVPSDFVELRYAYVDGSPAQYLEMVPASFIYERYPTGGESGKPVYMARDGSNFIFGPYPDNTYTIKGTYYKRPDSVRSSVTAFFTAHTDLYTYAGLLETEGYLGADNRIPLWESKYRIIKELIDRETEKARYAGPLTMR